MILFVLKIIYQIYIEKLYKYLYYEKNKKASLLIGIPYGISVLALVYMWISIIKEEPTDYKNATELIKKLKLEYPELNSK
jgi:hypothetical protein